MADDEATKTGLNENEESASEADGETTPGTQTNGETVAGGETAADPASDNNDAVLERQTTAITELKAEAGRVARLQAAVVGAILAGLSFARDRITLAAFVPPEQLVEAVGVLSIVTAFSLFFAVFLLLPRPHSEQTKFEWAVKNQSPIEPICRFRTQSAESLTCCIKKTRR